MREANEDFPNLSHSAASSDSTRLTSMGRGFLLNFLKVCGSSVEVIYERCVHRGLLAGAKTR